MRQVFKRSFWAAVVLFCLSSSYVLYCYYLKPLKLTEPQTLVVYPGMLFEQVTQEVSDRGWSSDVSWLRYLSMLKGDGRQIKIGEYLVDSSMTFSDLIKKMREGMVYTRRFVIPEGWNASQVLSALHAIQGDHRSETVYAVLNRLQESGRLPKDLEGWLFPDTYFYVKGRGFSDILLKAHQNMHDYLRKSWPKRSVRYKKKLDALIVASMVEREGLLRSELPRIAGVIISRLKIRMHLQICATVLYGLGLTRGPLTKAQLRQDTPYNTYLYYGLPPGPISMPGSAAIDAALHPQITGDLYYVLKPDGSHHFSKTYREHRQAIKKYLSNNKESK